MKTEEKNCAKVRLAVIGKANVGKSALTVRYLTRRYIGEYRSNADLLYRQTLTVNNATLEVEVVDVSNSDPSFFPEEAVYWADACAIVYDITDRNSMQHASELLQKVVQLRSQMPTVLLGNKSDLEHLRQVQEVEGRTVAIQNNNTPFYEISVAENTPSIYTAIDTLLNECKTMQNTQKSRKFSVSKMIGTLIGNGKSVPNMPLQGGTVVVCQKSDLYKSRVTRRRQNFTATASL